MPTDPTTLYFDLEKSGASYVHLYANEPGVTGPLFPAPIPVIGVSGAVGQGKTTFMLDIAAGPVKRIDVPSEMLKLKPNGYAPIDVFEWFWAVARSIPPGKFRVIAIDPAEEIEQGVSEWVWNNPLNFNTTRAQFMKMSGIYQGLVSSFWKSILMDLTSRCEVFTFANHIGQVFDGTGKAVHGKTKSKGRPVMKQSASLYINLTREKDAAGNLKDIPAGVVDLSEGGKTRLMTWAVRDGVRKKVPVLPPRMPIASPTAIREYFLNPPDSTHFKSGELAPDKVITADDRVEQQLQLTREQVELERLRLERIAEERRAATTASDEAAASVFAEAEPTSQGPESAEQKREEPEIIGTPENHASAPAPEQSPVVAAAAPYRRPAMLPNNLQDSVRILWTEFANVANKWTAEQAESMWREAVLKRFDAANSDALTEAQLDQIERMLVAKIEQHYVKVGTPDASPFRSADRIAV